MEVMLCEKEVKENLDKYLDGNWIAEMKLDGSRVVAIINNGVVNLIGRSGYRYNRQLPKIEKDLKKFPNCILDGEVVCNSFENLQKILHSNNKIAIKYLTDLFKPVFYIFDILEFKGKDLKKESLRVRNFALTTQIKEKNNVKILDNTFDIKELWNKAIDLNCEGIVLKNINSAYMNRRSKFWLKVKNFKERIIRVDKYEINPSGITATDGKHRVQIAGKYNSKKAKELIDTNGFVDIEIQYLQESENGFYRFPSFRKIIYK